MTCAASASPSTSAAARAGGTRLLTALGYCLGIPDMPVPLRLPPAWDADGSSVLIVSVTGWTDPLARPE